MEPQFWNERWHKGEIGFHMGRPHHDLVEFFSHLEVVAGATVFVPLCGKSLDLLWLSGQGARVLGVELSERAVRDFFAEHELTAHRQPEGEFSRFSCAGINLLCGDFFALRPEQLTEVSAVFDRAALVALPPELRRRYAEQLCRLLPSGCRMLLVSYAYAQEQMPGPPFAVPPAEVEELFGADFAIERLAERDALPTHEVLRQRGLSALTEFVSLLVRN